MAEHKQEPEADVGEPVGIVLSDSYPNTSPSLSRFVLTFTRLGTFAVVISAPSHAFSSASQRNRV